MIYLTFLFDSFFSFSQIAITKNGSQRPVSQPPPTSAMMKRILLGGILAACCVEAFVPPCAKGLITSVTGKSSLFEEKKPLPGQKLMRPVKRGGAVYGVLAVAWADNNSIKRRNWVSILAGLLVSAPVNRACSETVKSTPLGKETDLLKLKVIHVRLFGSYASFFLLSAFLPPVLQRSLHSLTHAQVGLKGLDYILENWDKETIKCNYAEVPRYAAFVLSFVSQPFFYILLGNFDVSETQAFFHAVERFQHLSGSRWIA